MFKRQSLGKEDLNEMREAEVDALGLKLKHIEAPESGRKFRRGRLLGPMEIH